MLGAEEKMLKQLGICPEAGRRLDLHTKVLPELKVGYCVQLKYIVGYNPLKSDRAGVIVMGSQIIL